MAIDTIINDLEKLNLYELNRVLHRIMNLLADDTNLSKVRDKLRIGMEVSFYHPHFKREMQAVIVKVNKSRVVLKPVSGAGPIEINLSAVNLAGVKCPETGKKAHNIRRADLKVGDGVGFIHESREVYGIVTKLNPKTAQLRIKTGETWMVAYEHLFSVIAGSKANNSGVYIEGEVVHRS